MENLSFLHDISCLNISGNNSEGTHERSISLLNFIVKSTVCGIGTILNSLVIIVIVYGSLMRTSVFMILLFLAVFDNLSLWFIFLRHDVIYSLLPLSSTLWLCRTIVFFIELAENVSSWLIVFISTERMIAVYYPLKVHIYCTRRKSAIAIVILLIIIFIIGLPVMLMGSIRTADGGDKCISFGSGSILETLFSIVAGLVYSIIPSCIICVFSTLTMKKIYYQHKFRNHHYDSQNGKKTKDIKNLSFTMFAVCIVFIVTTLPYE